MLNSTRSLAALDTSTSTPTPPFSFPFNVHHDIHASTLEKQRHSFADIVDVCIARCDDVHDPQDGWLLRLMHMLVLVMESTAICVVAVVMTMMMRRATFALPYSYNSNANDTSQALKLAERRADAIFHTIRQT